MTQFDVTLTCGGVATLVYWSCAMYKKNGCTLENLIVFALNVVGVVTGAYIFWGAYEVAKTLPQNAVGGGITGVCITLFTLQKIVTMIRELFTKAVEPK